MLLKVDGLTFAYSDHPVLHDLSFEIEPGEVVAVLGPNGVGKSTLFRCILGFLRSFTGEVTVDGDDVRTLAPKDMARRIAYIPQVSAPVFDYTVMELVLMGLASALPPLASPTQEHEMQALRVLDELGIAHLAHSSTAHISGGEYQLALLARALLQEAGVLIMDEPTANLDYGNQYRIMERIANLAGQGFSVILSAHDPNQVLMHATRVLIVRKGTLLADGAPREVMTADLLSNLYGIPVERIDVDSPSTDEGSPLQRVALCHPRPPRIEQRKEAADYDGRCAAR